MYFTSFEIFTVYLNNYVIFFFFQNKSEITKLLYHEIPTEFPLKT